MILFLLLAAPLAKGDADWYKTQIGTGIGNCGPTCVSMAIDWSIKKNISVEDIRNFIGYTRPDGSTDFMELTSALRHYKSDNDIETVESLNGLKSLVSRPDLIAIVLINTAFIEYNPDNIFGKSYTFEGGHYIILTDVISNYFEVQDPLQGSDRRYHVEQVWKAMKDRKVILIRNYDIQRNS